MVSFPLYGQPTAFAMSIEEERKMGDEFLVSVKNQLNLVEDDYVVQFINDLGNYIISHLETKPFQFNFYVVKEKQLNAFAGPGGHIFLYTGLNSCFHHLFQLLKKHKIYDWGMNDSTVTVD